MVIKNERILDIAAEVLARRPDATLQTIADSAGISRTTIFNRYPTRGDLIEALAMDTVARIGAVMQRVPTSMDDDVDVALLAVTDALMPLASRTIFLRLHVATHDVLETHWIEAVTPLAVYIATLQAHGRLRGRPGRPRRELPQRAAQSRKAKPEGIRTDRWEPAHWRTTSPGWNQDIWRDHAGGKLW